MPVHCCVIHYYINGQTYILLSSNCNEIHCSFSILHDQFICVRKLYLYIYTMCMHSHYNGTHPLSMPI